MKLLKGVSMHAGDGIKKIVWALEPFAEDSSLVDKMASSITALCGNARVTVEATSIVNDAMMKRLGELLPTEQSAGEASLQAFLEKTLDLLPGHLAKTVSILRATKDTNEAAAELLALHASQTAADVVALGTHAKKGIDRLLLGSFTEAFFSVADVPLLTLNPEAEPSGQLKQILFLTDFSKESRSAFNSMIPFARELGAKMTLFHRVLPSHTILPPQALAVYSQWVEKEASARAEAYQWEKSAREQGVEVTSVVDAFGEEVPETFLRAAGSFGSDLIAMKSNSRRVNSVLLSSYSRFVHSKLVPIKYGHWFNLHVEPGSNGSEYLGHL